jgi:hypothetical protein
MGRRTSSPTLSTAQLANETGDLLTDISAALEGAVSDLGYDMFRHVCHPQMRFYDV